MKLKILNLEMILHGKQLMISSENIAYLAGLFDGEGSIYFAKRIEKKKKHKGKGYRTSMSQRISVNQPFICSWDSIS